MYQHLKRVWSFLGIVRGGLVWQWKKTKKRLNSKENSIIKNDLQFYLQRDQKKRKEEKKGNTQVFFLRIWANIIVAAIVAMQMVVISNMGVEMHSNPMDFNLEVVEATVVKGIILQTRRVTISPTSKHHLDLLLSIKRVVPPSIIKCTT